MRVLCEQAGLSDAPVAHRDAPREMGCALHPLSRNHHNYPLRAHRQLVLSPQYQPAIAPRSAMSQASKAYSLSGTNMDNTLRAEQPTRTASSGQRGQALAITTMFLTALIGFCGFAIDMGVMRYQKRLLQSAADAAAIAGASNLSNGGVTAGAQTAAGANGFAYTSTQLSDCTASTASVGTVCVVVNNPPSTGPHASGTSSASYVEVYVALVQPTYFMRVLGFQHETVTARAVAGNIGSGVGCMFATDPATAGITGININGAATISAPNCGIVDNGDFNTKGNALTVNSGSFSVSGTASSGGTVTCAYTVTCPITNAPVAPDPLSYLTPPTVGTAGTFNPSNISSGDYCAPSMPNGTYVFPAGTYIFDGCGSNANFSVGGNTTITGTDVTFYFTNGATFSSVGTPVIQLSAPTSGAYAGILFYQNPKDTSGPTLGGNSSSYFQGALYFPGAEITFFGNDSFNSSAQYTVVDAAAVALSGHPTVNLSSDFSSLSGGTSILTSAVLAE